MKKLGLVLFTMGVALLMISIFFFGYPPYAVISHFGAVFIDGLISFRLPLFAGFVILLILIMFKTDNTDHHDHHDNNGGGQRRLQPIKVKSTYHNKY